MIAIERYAEVNVLGIVSFVSLCGLLSVPLSKGVEFPLRSGLGVSIAGAEFGVQQPNFSNRFPGNFDRDYTYPTGQTIGELTRRGIRFLRVPVRWERLQPNLNQSLNPAELAHLDQLLASAQEMGARVILDLHNYGRFRLATSTGNRDVIIDEVVNGKTLVTSSHLADLWRRIADRYVDNSAILAYGIMNEPHDLGVANWKVISQRAVDAIRSIDNQKWIFVAGDDWSSSERFELSNGPRAWIRDATGRIAYEAHCYLDADGSGVYSMSFERELALDASIFGRSKKRLLPFAQWCSRNRVHGFIGEFGVPAKDPRWNELLKVMLEELRQFNLPGCCWAAGPWWGDYPLSIEPMADSRKDTLSLQLLIHAQAPRQ